MQRKLIIFFIFVSSFLIAQSQLEKDLWIFGKGASLKFDSRIAPPYSLSDDFLINSPEAAATGIDQDGRLLFYSDGMNIWNSKHKLITNELLGSQDATQGISIYQDPSNDKLFLLITAHTSAFQDGSYLYKLDFSNNLDGELSKVKTHLDSSEKSFERVEVVRHYNKKDLWIILNPHIPDSTTYLVYLYQDGKLYYKDRFKSKMIRNFNKGYLKVTPNQNILVSANYDGNEIEFVEFDNQNGRITKSKLLTTPLFETGVYGLEFSQNSMNLYITTYELDSNTNDTFTSRCFQMDVNAFVYNGKLLYNKVVEFKHKRGDGGMWAMKRAINDRIYIARENKSYLSVIDAPNVWGSECRYKELGPGITTNNDKSLLGLPDTGPGRYEDEFEIKEFRFCIGGQFYFNPELELDYNRYKWMGMFQEFNNRALSIPNVTTSNSGMYYLKDRITNKIAMAIRLSVGNPTKIKFEIDPGNVVCNIDTVSINVTAHFDEYLWSTGSQDSSIKVTKSGKYFLTATNQYGCTVRDSVSIFFVPPPAFVIEKEILDCKDSFKLECSGVFNNYLWSTGDTTRSIIVTKMGTYTLKVSISDDCFTEKSITIESINRTPNLNFPLGSFICEDEVIEVEITNPHPHCNYLWSNGYKTLKTAFSKSGKYWVTAEDTITGCIFKKEFRIYSAEDFELEIIPIYNCDINDIQLTSNADTISFNFYWSNRSSNDTISAEQDKYYTLRVESKSGNCEFSDSILVKGYSYHSMKLDFPEGHSLCEGEDIEVKIRNPHPRYKYYWSNGEIGLIATISTAGAHTAFGIDTVTKCVKSIDFNIEDISDFELKIYENFDCDNSTNILITNADAEIFDFEWSTGSNSDSLFVTKTGIYNLKISTKSGCEFYDTIEVTRVQSFDLDIVSFPSDTICAPGEVILKLREKSPLITSQQWSTGSRKDSIIVTKSGRYILQANDKNFCYVRDTVYVEIIDLPSFDIASSKGNLICESEQTILSVVGLNNLSNYSYIWSNGKNSPSIVVNNAGTYQLIVSVKGSDCSDTASFTLNTKPAPKLNIIGKLNFCEGESTVLYANYDYGDIKWSNGETTDSILVNMSGVYYATVDGKLGCIVSDTVKVTLNRTPEFDIIGENIICYGDTAVLLCDKVFDEYLWSTGSTNNSIQVVLPGIYTLIVVDTNGCTNTKSFVVNMSSESFTVNEVGIQKDSLLIGDETEFYFTINNKGLNDEDYSISFNSSFENVRVNNNESVQYKSKLKANELGPNTLSVFIRHNGKTIGDCSNDTIIDYHYNVYTIMKANLTDKYFTYLNEDYEYPISFSSDIPLNLRLMFDLNLPYNIFYIQEPVLFDNIVSISNKLDTFVVGKTMLGAPFKQNTYFNSISTDNPYVIIDTNNGSIEIGQVCLNDKRLIVFDFYEGVDIYPNPASDYLTIDLIDNSTREFKITIINETGAEVYNNILEINDNSRIEIGNLPSGSYIMHLKSDIWSETFKFNKVK
jgi:cytochrome b involved in lipid metabolism